MNVITPDILLDRCREADVRRDELDRERSELFVQRRAMLLAYLKKKYGPVPDMGDYLVDAQHLPTDKVEEEFLRRYKEVNGTTPRILLEERT